MANKENIITNHYDYGDNNYNHCDYDNITTTITTTITSTTTATTGNNNNNQLLKIQVSDNNPEEGKTENFMFEFPCIIS